MPDPQIDRFALVDPTAHRAVIYEGRQAAAMIEIKGGGQVDGPKPIPPGLHIGMWLQPASAQEWQVGEAPYAELISQMLERSTLQTLIFLFVTVLDPELDMETRQLGAHELEEKLATLLGGTVFSEFRRIVTEPPIPETASTRDAPFKGKGAELLNEIVAKWGHRPRDA
jgi:hypothetical protein